MQKTNALIAIAIGLVVSAGAMAASPHSATLAAGHLLPVGSALHVTSTAGVTAYDNLPQLESFDVAAGNTVCSLTVSVTFDAASARILSSTDTPAILKCPGMGHSHAVKGVLTTEPGAKPASGPGMQGLAARDIHAFQNHIVAKLPPKTTANFFVLEPIMWPKN